MIAVIAAMGGEIEGDRQPHLPGSKVLAVEAVRLLGGRKSGILPDRPRPVRVHRRPRPAQIWRDAGQCLTPWEAGGLDLLEIGFGVERRGGDPPRGVPVEAGGRRSPPPGVGRAPPTPAPRRGVGGASPFFFFSLP